MSLQLKHVQNLLYRLITAPEGVAEGLAAETALPSGGITHIIGGDERISAQDRVDIYANMYFYRLLEVLQEDYPATAAALGEANFHNVVTGYLLDYRPTEPSVMWAGKFLADYLRDHPMRAEVPFIADLAMLERSTIDIFCAADSPVLEAAEMHAVPPERWATVTMRRIPATAILKAGWKVVPVLRAIEEKTDWSTPAQEPNQILVWRRNSRVSYRELEDREAAAITALAETSTFGKLCEILAGDLPEDQAPGVISATLARWLADGILTRPRTRTRK